MSSKVKLLSDAGKIDCPSFVKDTHYEVAMGSVAYGVSNDMSDIDVYGFCIPPKEYLFPEQAGYIHGFNSNNAPKFDQWQKHQINFLEKDYDIQIFNIVKYFRLVTDNNPNMIDSLFVPNHCILHISKIGKMIRENRHLFLSKKVFHSFKGYAYSQLNKAKNKHITAFIKINKQLLNVTPEMFDSLVQYKDFVLSEICDENRNLRRKLFQNDDHFYYYSDVVKSIRDFNWEGKRAESFVQHGFDTKFGYHIVRLVGECEQILTTGDLILDQDSDRLKAIRSGDWSLDDVESWFHAKEKDLEVVYNTSAKVPYKPDEKQIANLLLNCIEEYYGNVDNIMNRPDRDKITVNGILEVLKLHGYK